jgi:hypothetical protein
VSPGDVVVGMRVQERFGRGPTYAVSGEPFDANEPNRRRKPGLPEWWRVQLSWTDAAGPWVTHRDVAALDVVEQVALFS